MSTPQSAESPGPYWARTLDEGAAFMRAADAHPLEESGEPLVPIGLAARAAGVWIDSTATVHRTGRPTDLRLRRSNVEALLAVASDLHDEGLMLVVHDALRTPADQATLGRDPRALANVGRLVERYDLRPSDEQLVGWLGVMIAATPRTAGHVSGAAVDVSVRLTDGSELDRGASYPNWSEQMPMDSPFVTPDQAEARRRINAAMARHGFHALPFEFWHYSRGDTLAAIVSGDPAPARFGPVEVALDGGATPFEQRERFNEPGLLLALLRDLSAQVA